MLSTSFIFSIILQLALPVAICYVLIRRYKTEWRLCLVGGISYLVYWVAQPLVGQLVTDNDLYNTQIAGLPVIWILLFEGLLIGLVEQAIRAGAFWYARARVRAWGGGLTVTAGQAALGLLLTGLQLLLFFVSWSALTGSRGQGMDLTPEQLAGLGAQIESFWALPWYFPLQIVVQSLAILLMQFALGMMVWQAVNQKAWVWLGAAVLWAIALNTLFKVLAQSGAEPLTSLVFVFTAALHAGFLYILNQKTAEFAPAPAGK